MTKDELIAILTTYFNEHIPFNRLLGIQVESVGREACCMRLEMKPELIGNTFQQILHGGVTATMLDVTGGLAALIHTVDKLSELNPDEIKHRLRRVGTIDMRVDYLRPGKGSMFKATAEVIRHGQKIAVTRMHLRNEREQEIAVGTATYVIS